MFIRHGGSTGNAVMGEELHGPSGAGERCKVKEWVTREPERPGTVHVQDGRSGVQPALNPNPGPMPCLRAIGSARATAQTERTHMAPKGANNKPEGCRVGSRSALIILPKTGTRGHRDPAEGRGAPRDRTR